MQKPYLHGCSSCFWTRLLTEVPDDHFQLWSCVRQSFGTVRPNLLIVFCAMMFIGAMTRPGIEQMLERGISRLQPYFTSFLMSFLRRSGFCDAPLWLPKASASSKSCLRSDSFKASNGHLLPLSRKVFICCQSGWSPKIVWRVDVGFNSLLGPRGESFCAFSASPRSKSYRSNMLRLCLAPSAVKTKLNSGRDGVMQGVLMTTWICWIKSLGQSNDGNSCKSRSQASLLGVEMQGKFLHSPSNCASCFVDDANVVS